MTTLGVKITELPAAGALSLSDPVPEVNGGTTSKTTWNAVLALFQSNASGLWDISITGNAGTVTTNANLTGPVTSVGNATSITDGAITTSKIGNAQVTYAKIQTETASTLLGNPTGGSATISEITLGATLAFVGSALRTGAISGAVTSAANSFVTTLNTDVVGTANIIDGAVTYAKIQNVAATSLLGNPTGGSTVVSEVTLGATLAFSGSVIQTNPLTGDVTTATNSFVTTIADNAITTVKINAAAVTYAKIQAIGATSILGNATGAPATVAELTLGATLAFSGSSIRTTAFTGDVTSSANSFATTIANGVVTYAKMQTASANTLLGNSSGITGAIGEITLGATLSFSASVLRTNAITGDVTAAANSFVTTIASNAITTGKIANGAVTYAKIQDVAAISLLGNPTGSSASTSEISLGTTLAFVSSQIRTTALTGDVTSSANSFATTIANGVVTYAKIQNVGASSLIGNPTGGSTVASEITLGATLAFSGTAIQTVAHTGDVTSAANSFALTIANNAITTAKINNSAVTYAKIQNVAATSLLGNPTGGSTVTSEITVGATLAFVSTALQTLAMTGDVTTSANSFATTIANNAVTTAKINNSAVTYAKIQDVTGSRLLGNYNAGANAPVEIQPGATLAFALNVIQTVAMTGDVTTAANSFATTIANNAVTTAKINNAAVTYAKIQNVAANSVIGNNTGSAAAPTDIAISSFASGNPNMIIGGEFGTNPWQRQVTFSTPGGLTADRWKVVQNTSATYTVTKDTDAPASSASSALSSASYKFAFTSTTAAAAAGYLYLEQSIEGYLYSNIAQTPFTLSFWVKASLTGTYCVHFTNLGQDRHYIAEYTVNVANTWEFKSITVSASPSAGTWNYTNSAGLYVDFILSCGVNNNGGTAGAWSSTFKLATTNQVNAQVNGGTFFIDLIKVERGSIATPYIIEPLEKILLDCYRYYYKSYSSGVYPGASSFNGAVYFPVGRLIASAPASIGSFLLPSSMPRVPTVVVYSPVSGSSGNVYNYTTTADLAADESGLSSSNLKFRATATTIAAAVCEAQFTAEAEVF